MSGPQHSGNPGLLPDFQPLVRFQSLRPAWGRLRGIARCSSGDSDQREVLKV